MIDTSKLKYTESHEWVQLSDKLATVGITDHAQKEMSDVVFVELPEVGREVNQKDPVMVVESVKAAFDIYAPATGKIVKINEHLKENPELVNQSPHEEGWFFQMECTDPTQVESLLTEEQYHSVKEQK